MVFRGNPFWTFAIGTRKVAEVDVNFDGLLVGIRVKFGVNGRNGAKKIGGVGEGGGGEKFVKFGKRVLDSTPVVNSSQSEVSRWRKLALGRKEK